MSGLFIVSLDCEGKWGMADGLQPYHQQLTDEALARVYEKLVGLFAAYEVPATFAFVMAFTLTAQEREGFAEQLAPRPAGSDSWMDHFWSAQARGDKEGWFQPEALERARAEPSHEIACHSFCHRPLDDRTSGPATARAELAAAVQVGKLKGLALRTFIYPRNAVGNVPLLAEAGLIGYRDSLRRPRGKVGRAIKLAEELNIFAAPQAARPPRGDGVVPIPAGYFFNWRFGARRRIPPAVTVARWTRLIDRVESGQVAHLWLHPHNLITAPDTEGPLETVLAHAARRRDAGRLEIVTQQQYAERMRRSPGEVESLWNSSSG